MLPLLDQLPTGARVLDLGAGAGSFSTARGDLLVVRLDLERPHRLGEGAYVFGDAARLPFRTGAFDLVVSNHSLEHCVELEATVREIGRVMKPAGVLYVAVPDATTVADRVYRWLGKGGGHVNPFRSSQEVAELITRLSGLPISGTTVLFSSFSFLNRHNFISRPPRKIALFAFGNEHFLAISLAILRGLDRRCGTRLSRYGWSFLFGTAPGTPPGEVWLNVCVRCGSGHSEAFLRKNAPLQRFLGMFPAYRCPACRGFNLLTREFTPRA
jgi:SAM-dependent methyltransferase